jgi:hypothetical protein
MAYVFGPVNGEAILATMAWVELKEVTVTLPCPLAPAGGGTSMAQAVDARTVRVEAGKEPRFYCLVQ